MNPSESTQAWVNLTVPSQGFFYKDNTGRDRLADGLMQIRKLSFQELSNLQSQGVDVMQRISNIIRNASRFIPLTNGATPLLADELLITDRMAVLFNQRVISFGSKYSFGWRCGACKQQSKFEIDIVKDMPEITATMVQDKLSQLEVPQELVEPFPVVLADAGSTVMCRLLRGKDELEIFKQAKRRKMTTLDPTDPSHVIRLALQIVTIDGKQVDTREKEMFIRNMTAADSLRIEHATELRETGIDTKVTPICTSCGNEQEMEMPFDAEFFRPTRL